MRHRSSRSSTLLAPLLVLALLAAACGGGDDDASSGASDGDGATTSEPVGDIDPEGSFTYAYPLTLSRMDPHKANISQDAVTLFPAYDRLVHLTPEGELVPGLAESWEFSDDVRTLTMHLREGVTFHDGAVFDAEAAKKNLDRAKTIEGSSVTNDVATIESVDVVDERTIQLSFNVPNASILGVLADRAGIQVSPEAIDGGVDLDEEMVGAGPFRMVEHTPGASTTFERFEEYWGEPAGVKTLEIKVMADAVARLNAYRSGEVDGTSIGPNQVAEVESDPTANLTFNTELLFYFITQNRTRAGQDDLRVRQAMVHALDRESICETIMFGHCELTDQPFPPGYWAYNDEIDDVLYDYDPEKAKQLLAEAGVESMDITLLTPAGLSTYPEVADVIESQWREVGINTTLQAVEPTRISQMVFEGTGDAILAGWGGRADPSVTFAQRTGATAFNNPGGHSTPKMDELYAASIATADHEERTAILRDAAREAAESVLEFVLFFPKTPYVTADHVVDFTPYLSSKPEFRSVAVTAR